MAFLPPLFVAGLFFVAAVTAVGVMAYLAWRGSKPSDFFTETMSDRYDVKLPIALINGYEQLKEKLQAKVEQSLPADADGEDESLWVQHLSREDQDSLKEALLKRLEKTIEVLDRVQRERPGFWKLWREKLVSETFFNSLCDGEHEINHQLQQCFLEARELAPIEPGWADQDYIFQLGIHRWRSGQRDVAIKKDQKKVAELVKKEKEKEARREEVEKRLEEERRLKEERDAEKAMEKLLREEESTSKKDKGKIKEKAVAKPKGAKKK